MGGHTVTGADGRTWNVRRRWIPRLGSESLWSRFRRRTKGTMARLREGMDADPDLGCLGNAADDLVVAVVIVLVVLVVLLAAYVAIPLLVAAIDILLLLLLGLLGVAGRVLFGRPWLVVARADDGTELHWDVVGWDASRSLVGDVAGCLASGSALPPMERSAEGSV